MKVCYTDIENMYVRANVNFKITDIIKKDGEMTITAEDVGEKVVIVISKEELIRIYASAL